MAPHTFQAGGKVGMTTILIKFQLQKSYLLDPRDEQAQRKPCTKREKLHLNPTSASIMSLEQNRNTIRAPKSNSLS